MEDLRMKKHVTAVGALHIGFGILGLVVAILIYFGLGIAKNLIQNEEIPMIVINAIDFISISLPLFFIFMSTLGIIGGIGLLSLQPWARYLVIVVAALGCLNIPIGTLKGVYSLWVLFQNETIRLFEQKTVQNSPGNPVI